jgi:hypothetical protein
MHASLRDLLLSSAAFVLSVAALAQTPRTPVLVELFTSEGCSSCPSADALLAHLLKDQPVSSADILVLEEHVDYWDQLGWHDRFSSHEFTDRQSRYVRRFGLDDNYTPQMVVDGADQFVGNDAAHALRSIAQAARAPKSSLNLSPLTFDANHITGTVSILPSAIPPPRSDLFAAVIETMASTQVLHGENGGRTLNHVSVLRTLQRIGSPGDAISAPLKFSVAAPSDTSTTRLRVVVFLQRADQGPILGVVASAPNAGNRRLPVTHTLH